MDRRKFLSVGLCAGSGVFHAVRSAGAVPCVPLGLQIDGQSVGDGSCQPLSAGADHLESLAATLAPGSMSTALGDTGASQQALNTIQWANRFFYDPIRHTAHLLGKNASSGGSQRSNCQYDASANTWSTSIYGGSELGHIYESIAYDQAAGELYTGTWASSAIKRWKHGSALASWVDPVSTYSGQISDSVQPTLCWFPNLFGTGDGGLLVIAATSTGTRAVAWRRSTASWSAIPGISDNVSSQYAQFGAIEYVRSGNYCIVALDPAGGGRTYRVPAGSGGVLATATPVAQVPIRCGFVGQGNVGVLIDSPSAGGQSYILEKGGSSRVWKFDGSTWSLQPYSHPLEGSNENWVVASVNPHGVFWSQDASATSPSRVWRPNS